MKKGPKKKPKALRFIKTSITIPPREYQKAQQRASDAGSVSAYIAGLIRRDSTKRRAA